MFRTYTKQSRGAWQERRVFEYGGWGQNENWTRRGCSILLKRLNHDGTHRTIRFGPRVIDIDILLYNDLVMKNDNLEIPHPRMSERRFVLVPLVEIAPDVEHTILSSGIRELLEKLPDVGDVHFFAD